VADMRLAEQKSASADAPETMVAPPVTAEVAVEGVVQANSLAVLLTQVILGLQTGLSSASGVDSTLP
jgi:hypothetical protein